MRSIFSVKKKEKKDTHTNKIIKNWYRTSENLKLQIKIYYISIKYTVHAL